MSNSDPRVIEILPGTTDIVGAQEVWAAEGKVYVVLLEMGPNNPGEKYSTSSIKKRLLALSTEREQGE
jgi:hypothetical protein